MYVNGFQDAEIAYRREQLAQAFRAGATRNAAGGRRRHHLLHRNHDRRA